MLTPTILTIDGVTFPAVPLSDAPDPKDRAEENAWAAMHALEDIRKRPIPEHWQKRGIDEWQAVMMHVLKPISQHYQVDEDEVLAMWAGHYGTGLVLLGLVELEQKGDSNANPDEAAVAENPA